MAKPDRRKEQEQQAERKQGAGREPARTSRNADIRARTMRLHKGDVGRPGTNEEIFQGFKEKELR
jgi:hypothetical protein